VPSSPQFDAIEPILRVPDVPAALDWYTRVLGASGRWEWRATPEAEVSHGGCSLGRANLQFSTGQGDEAGAYWFRSRFASSADIDAYAATVERAAGSLASRPRDEPWGWREFQVYDPQGRLLRVAGPISQDRPRGEPVAAEVIHRKPTPQEWEAITRAVGWDDNPFHRASELLEHTRHGVVARLAGQTVGCVLILSEGVNSAYLSDVAVLPGHQGKGIGDAMMRAVVGWCGEHLEPTAVLSLLTGRGTAPFYERHGFRGGDEGGGYGMSRRNGI
jgi:GNAT superfamily N-acetyltransferase